MANLAAIRQRRHRALVAAGRRKLLIEVEFDRLAICLADHDKFLQTENPTPAELAAAIERMLTALVTRYEQQRWGELDWPP